MNTIMVGNVCVDQHRKVELLYLEDEYVSKEAVPITLLTEYVDEIDLLDSDGGQTEFHVGCLLSVIRMRMVESASGIKSKMLHFFYFIFYGNCKKKAKSLFIPIIHQGGICVISLKLKRKYFVL